MLFLQNLLISFQIKGYWFICIFIIKLYIIGPSGVRAQPLGVAAERSVHYIFWNYFSFFSFLRHILFFQKGLSQGYEILHGVLSNKKNKIWGKTKFETPPSSPLGGLF